MLDPKYKEISQFIDAEGILTALPAKFKKKLIAIYYLAEQIPAGKEYSEQDINLEINKRTAFSDVATIRREMFNCRFLERSQDGSVYTKNEMPGLDDFLSRKL